MEEISQDEKSTFLLLTVFLQLENEMTHQKNQKEKLVNVNPDKKNCSVEKNVDHELKHSLKAVRRTVQPTNYW